MARPTLGLLENQILDRLARDFGDRAARQHLHIVIGFVEEHVLEVERVAGDMQRHDLA